MKPRLIRLLLLTALLLVGVLTVQANPLAYDLSWWKVAGGGGDSQGGPYRLQGTAGQAEPGVLNGGPYTLSGSFWSASSASSSTSRIFIPLMVKQ